MAGVVQPAAAQDLRGPREAPPAGFTGQQYVDSRGCVFLRGGLGGQVTWVPRIGRDRRQLCGFPPTFSPEPPVAVAVAPAPEPAPRPTVRRPGDPVDTVASLTTPPRVRAAPAPAPSVAPAPAPRVAAAAPAGVTPGCPGHAPYGERVELRDGRTALLCVRSPDGIPAFARRIEAEIARAPEPVPAAPEVVALAAPAPVITERVGATAGVGPTYYPDGRISCPGWAPIARAVPLRGGGSTLLCFGDVSGIPPVAGAAVVAASPAPRAAVPAAVPAPPPGYRMAWRDDRLNPNRGPRTAAGQAQQDQFWTREVPARLVADVPKAKTKAAAVPRATMSASAARTPAKQAAATSGRFYVQVGSFAVAGNADSARARLAAAGLPTATGRGTIKGKPVQVVHAGPFATAGQAQAALAAARQSGFGDAFIR